MPRDDRYPAWDRDKFQSEGWSGRCNAVLFRPWPPFFNNLQAALFTFGCNWLHFRQFPYLKIKALLHCVRRFDFGTSRNRKPAGQRSRWTLQSFWWIRFYSNGKQIHESSKSRKYSAAQDLLKQRIVEMDSGQYAGPTAEKIKVATLLDGLIAVYETNDKSVNWVRDVDKRLRPFFGHMRAARVETDQLHEYVAYRRGQGVTSATINRELALLRRSFNLARRSTPPKVKRVPVIPKLKESAARSGFFEHHEFTFLRRELSEHLQPVITFAYTRLSPRGDP